MTLRQVLKASVRTSRFFDCVAQMDYGDLHISFGSINKGNSKMRLSHVTLCSFHVFNIPTFDHEVFGIYERPSMSLISEEEE